MGRRGNANLRALFGDEAVHELDLGAAALRHVLRHGRPLQVTARRGVGASQHQRLDLIQRAAIAFRCQRQLLRLERADLTKCEAEGLPNAYRLATQVDTYAADRVVSVARIAAQSGRCRYAVAHAVDAELGPPFAPEIVGGMRRVDAIQHLREFLDPAGDTAVRLSDVERDDVGV